MTLLTQKKTDPEMIKEIAQRASNLTDGKYDYMTVSMDFEACHKANNLNLEKLLAFDDFNFMHDVAGVNRCLDHVTAELKNYFWPRCGGR